MKESGEFLSILYSFLSQKQEVGTEAEVDAEGDGQGVKVVTVGAVEGEPGTKTIGGSEAVGVVDGGVSRVHPSESETRITDGECAKVGHSVKVGVTTGNADIADLRGEAIPKGDSDFRMKGETSVEGP